MYKEPRPMREIHEIQEKIYETEKYLTNKEKLVLLHKEAEEFKKKYRLKFRKANNIA